MQSSVLGLASEHFGGLGDGWQQGEHDDAVVRLHHGIPAWDNDLVPAGHRTENHPGVELAILAVFVFLYSAVAGGIERTRISGPMVFTVVGLVIGPLGLRWLQPDLDDDGLRVLADLTLALVLFIDAANADLGVVKRGFRIPRRMLALSRTIEINLRQQLGETELPEKIQPEDGVLM